MVTTEYAVTSAGMVKSATADKVWGVSGVLATPVTKTSMSYVKVSVIAQTAAAAYGHNAWLKARGASEVTLVELTWAEARRMGSAWEYATVL